jgi:hypothetical protein
MCRGVVLLRNSATDLKNCSAALIGSAISTTTAGEADFAVTSAARASWLITR